MPTSTIDPVCGMEVNTSDAEHREHAGKSYYFCSLDCAVEFEKNPEHCLTHPPDQIAPSSPKEASQGHADLNATFTCPMHPEIRQLGPGTCPKCGMALEPIEVSLDEGPNLELLDMTRRFKWSLVFTPALLILAMSERGPNWIQMALASPVVLICGKPILKRGYESFKSLQLNMFSLIALGTAVAYLYSVIATLVPGIFPPALLNPHTGQLSVYFEAAAVITALVLLGQVLELRARGQTAGAIRALLGLAPKSARLVDTDGSERDIALQEIEVGMKLRVRPGEKIPVDGILIEGSSAVDESMISGESVPLLKNAGAPLIGGTVNGTGSFVMRAERIGSSTVLAQIVRMVGEAQRSRTQIQRLADEVSSYFVPAVIAIAVITFAIWAWIGPEPKMAWALVNAISVLIVACPCALGLATPMSIMVGTGKGAQNGVLIKNAESLERLEKVDTLLIDKTGTLTEGKPQLLSIHVAATSHLPTLLESAAALEKSSEHPLAQAVIRGALERGVRIDGISSEEFESVTGQGIRGLVNKKSVAIGNENFMNRLGVNRSELDSKTEELRALGQTVLFVAIDNKLAGVLGIADPIKEAAVEAVPRLIADGLRIIMLTGDHATTARVVASRLGITEFESEVLPDRKRQVVLEHQQKGHVVCMAGDGINDAPALAQADVGIAMGHGTDVALKSAGITLLHGDLRGILSARVLSRVTLRNIRQNLFFAFAYNVVGVSIAAGILYPFTGTLLNPMIASAAMSLSSVSVITNALRLKRTIL